jgi:hypothetical protein
MEKLQQGLETELYYLYTSLFLWPEVGILGYKSQFDHIFFLRRRREKILVKLTRGPQNDSRGHKNSVEYN